MAVVQSALLALVRAIGERDDEAAARMLADEPDLALAALKAGATRLDADLFWFDRINHYAYKGDTALHLAAAAHGPELVDTLLELGADVSARNHRGAQPLHYAADGSPGSDGWHPRAQATVIATLVAAGADPNAKDKSGVAPLHRAVRTRSAEAVGALLDAGADANLRNGSGSSPMKLATMATGRGGSGAREPVEQQGEIVELLRSRGGS